MSAYRVQIDSPPELAEQSSRSSDDDDKPDVDDPLELAGITFEIGTYMSPVVDSLHWRNDRVCSWCGNCNECNEIEQLRLSSGAIALLNDAWCRENRGCVGGRRKNSHP
jgi:hypothetical protein